MNKNESLVQLSRLALTGRRQDIQKYIQRMTRSKDLSDVKEQLQQLLAESPTVATPLRSASYEALPVDLDSRMQLIRLEQHPSIDHTPVWAPAVKQPLDTIVNERRQSGELFKVGLMPLRSALFVGPPGVGKTLAARWLADKLGLPLMILDLSAVMSSYLGRTGSNVRMVLDYAKSTDCVLLIDEIDAIGKKRDDDSEIGELKRLVTVLLQEIDDWPPSGLMIAATNHPDLLDPAIWRRFDAIIDFPNPSRSSIRKAISSYLGNHNVGLDVKLLDLLSVILEGQSFSHVEKLSYQFRKEAVLQETSIAEIISEYIHESLKSMDRERLYDAAALLGELGHSQRFISEITGLSRDTLRKIRKER